MARDTESEFFAGLLELQYWQGPQKRLKELAKSVPWARGWPHDTKAFWNAEAFMWGYKIDKEKRKLIEKELSFLRGDGRRNLDLGCGAYSYVPSVGFDISEKMLQFNERCAEKVVGDLEKPLPLLDGSFDSVTAVFVLNYVKNHEQLLKEIYRVLKRKGCFVIVLYEGKINDWQRQKEVNEFSENEWREAMGEAGFTVKIFRKGGLLFFHGIQSNS